MTSMTLHVNGRDMTVTSAPTAPLLDVLRDEVGDTSPKPGCREGRCGSCTVLFDGEPVLSCLTPLARAEGVDVTTVLGLGDPSGNGQLDEVQQAFSRAGALQCGICTPGMVLAAKALLAERPDATRAEIREGLVNNICRCTGYTKILDAVESLTEHAGEGGRG